MFNKDKRSFFERITGSVPYDESEEEEVVISTIPNSSTQRSQNNAGWLREDEEVEEEGELTVDVYQTATEVIVQTMVAGVKPEDLNISITQEMISIKGRRERPGESPDANYLYRELYWGPFGRTIMLPAEVEAEEAEAIERHGLLTIRLPKTDKEKVQRIKVKSI
jgi:HSP20 family molecular chaperone IbpA